MLKWNEAECSEFLGTTAGALDNDRRILGFKIAKDGVALHISLLPEDEIVYFALFRDGVDQPIMGTHFLRCQRAEFVRQGEGGARYLEFILGEIDRATRGADALSVKSVRISVDPNIQIGFISDSGSERVLRPAA